MEHLECIWTKCGRGAERFFFLAVLEFFFLAIASFPLCHKCIRVARGDGHGPRAKLRDAICGPVRSNHSPPVPRPVCAPSSSAAAQSATSRTSIIEIGERANGCEHSSASRRGPATPVHGQRCEQTSGPRGTGRPRRSLLGRVAARDKEPKARRDGPKSFRERLRVVVCGTEALHAFMHRLCLFGVPGQHINALGTATARHEGADDGGTDATRGATDDHRWERGSGDGGEARSDA